ncbi:MAG: hypothetical protein R6U58_14675 [Bacteroidales bacterium]
MNLFIHILFITSILLTYVIAFITIKPFMINRRRKYSTLCLKISYLLYLAVFLTAIYCFVFYGDLEMEKQFRDTFFILSMILLFLPNLGMMARRSIKHQRVFFNYFFSVMNLLLIYFIYFLLSHSEWIF